MRHVSNLALWRVRCYTRATMPTKKRRTRDITIRARVTPEQAAMFQRAAEHAAERRGTGTFSDWVREVLLQAARQELGDSALD